MRITNTKSLLLTLLPWILTRTLDCSSTLLGIDHEHCHELPCENFFLLSFYMCMGFAYQSNYFYHQWLLVYLLVNYYCPLVDCSSITSVL